MGQNQKSFKETIEKEIEAMLRTENSPKVTCDPRLVHAVLGLVSESGEIATELKAHIMYNKPLAVINLKEEMGDLWWFFRLMLVYLADITKATPAETFKSIMEINKVKLAARYPDGFNAKQATTLRNTNNELNAMENADSTGLKEFAFSFDMHSALAEKYIIVKAANLNNAMAFANKICGSWQYVYTTLEEVPKELTLLHTYTDTALE